MDTNGAWNAPASMPMGSRTGENNAMPMGSRTGENNAMPMGSRAGENNAMPMGRGMLGGRNNLNRMQELAETAMPGNQIEAHTTPNAENQEKPRAAASMPENQQIPSEAQMLSNQTAQAPAPISSSQREFQAEAVIEVSQTQAQAEAAMQVSQTETQAEASMPISQENQAQAADGQVAAEECRAGNYGSYVCKPAYGQQSRGTAFENKGITHDMMQEYLGVQR